MAQNIKTYNDPVLKSFIRGYIPDDGDYIHQQLIPTLPVKVKRGDLKNIGTEFLRVSSKVIANRAETPEVTVSMTLSDGWNCEKTGLKMMITEEDGEEFNPESWESGMEEARETFAKLIKCGLWLGKEKEVADVLTDTSIITNNITLSGSTQWNNGSSSDPLKIVRTAQDAIYSSIGREANVAYMSRDVFRTLQNHPALLERIGVNDTSNKLLGVSEAQLALALKVDKVLVGRSRYESSKEGQTSSMMNIWGKDFGLLYVNPQPTPSRYEFSFGYNFQLQDMVPDYWMINDPKNAQFVRIQEKRDLLVLKATAAYLVKSAIA